MSKASVRVEASEQVARHVTLRDVAHACGLSVYPVSRVLNGKPGVTEETAAKVMKVAAELGYNRAQNDLARRLSLRKSGKTPINHLIGVLMPSHLEKVNFFFSLFRGILETLSSSGYGMLMMPTYNLVEHRGVPIHFSPSVVRGEVDGLVIHQRLDSSLVRYLRQDAGFGDRPIVTMTSAMDEHPAVLRDERLGARLALAHLLALGHRRILYFTRQTVGYPLDERLIGYSDACAEAGLPMAQCLIPVPIVHDFLAEEPLCAALRDHPEATALMAQNDPTALDACYTIQRLGRRIPDDISVIGWDDSDPFPDETGRNQLTSVHFDLVGLGRKAAGNLISLIEGDEVAVDQVVMPPTLMARGTTAPPLEPSCGNRTHPH